MVPEIFCIEIKALEFVGFSYMPNSGEERHNVTEIYGYHNFKKFLSMIL
jgi:hypothetical protein